MRLPEFMRRRSKPRDDRNYWTGDCLCGICRHEWTAVVEIGIGESEPMVNLECPSCGNYAGHPE